MAILIISIFLSISISLESVGVWFRYIGGINGQAALGYSSHVRFATAGRFFIIISAPIIGYMVDRGVPSSKIAIAGILTFLIVAMVLVVLRSPSVLMFRLYNLINKSDFRSPNTSDEREVHLLHKKVLLYSLVSFIFTAGGVLYVNLLATKWPEYRASIIQMSAFFTMFGTMLHTFSIDPILARGCDENSRASKVLISSFIRGRILGSVALSLIFFAIFMGE